MRSVVNKAFVLMLIVILTIPTLVFAVDVVSITPVDPEVKNDLTLGLNQPYGLSYDHYGVVYIADTYNNMIKKVTSNGIELVAGGFDGYNTMGFSKGSLVDGTVLSARFNKPRDVLAVKTGAIYVADTGNNVIRKIENGTVSTISGTGKSGLADGAANLAQFNLPSALAMNSDGMIYVADTLNNSIRVVSKEGAVKTLSFVPDGKTLTSGELNEPSDLLFDNQGVLYILDSGNQSIKRVKDGVISLVAGNVNDVDVETGYVEAGLVNGLASDAKFNFPKGFALDDNGNFFVSDSWNHVIRVVTTDGKVGTYTGAPFSGNVMGDLKEARYNTPTGIIVKNGTLVFSDMWNNEIKELKIDYSDASFGYSEEALKALIDSSQTTDHWTYWENKKKIDLDKPINSEEGVIYMPFKATMMHLGYDISWDAVSRRVLYSNTDKSGFIEASSGMKIFEDNSYLSVDKLEQIVDKTFEILKDYKAVIEINQ